MYIASHIPAAGYGWLILQTFAVLLVIALASWALIRFARPGFKTQLKDRRMKILERLALEPRRSLYLVEIDGETMILGINDGNMSVIQKPEPEPETETPPQ